MAGGCLAIHKPGLWMEPAQNLPPDFDGVFNEYGDYVYSLASRMTGSRPEAEDVLQETFLRVFRFLSSFRGGSLKSWVRRIAVNVVFSRNRSASSQERPVDTTEIVVADPEPEPGTVVCQGDFGESLELALQNLPEEYRCAMLLREVEQLSYDEMATMLNVPVGTVRSRLSRARQMLRRALSAGESP